MISVVIPAHDEAVTIERCLRALLSAAEEGEFDVIVVANGCRDDTARIAQRVDPTIRVILQEHASKAVALNAGDAAARFFPRIYLDADVVTTAPDVRLVAAALRGSADVASPTLKVNLEGRPWGVRSWYQIWGQLPYAADGLIGSGIYGLSEAGRRSFDTFPDTMADDLFVRSRLPEARRLVVPEAIFEIQAPRTVRSLLRVRARVSAVNRRVLDSADDLLASERRQLAAGHRRCLVGLVRQPRQGLKVVLYVAIGLLARLLAALMWPKQRSVQWLRDETNRSGST